VPGSEPVEPAVPSTEPSAETSKGRGGPWTFNHATGQFTYAIETDAQVAQLPDSSVFRPIPQTTHHVTIDWTDSGVVVLDPPTPTSLKCDSSAALYTRASSLIVPLPEQLSAGMTWADSSTTNGCRGSIPTTTTLLRRFVVIGDTTYHDLPVVLIMRSDTIVAKGEGNEGPHRIVLGAHGNGSTALYYDVATGRFMGSQGSQLTQVDITTSGRTSQFLQRIEERVTLTRPETTQQ